MIIEGNSEEKSKIWNVDEEKKLPSFRSTSTATLRGSLRGRRYRGVGTRGAQSAGSVGGSASTSSGSVPKSVAHEDDSDSVKSTRMPIRSPSPISVLPQNKTLALLYIFPYGKMPIRPFFDGRIVKSTSFRTAFWGDDTTSF